MNLKPSWTHEFTQGVKDAVSGKSDQCKCQEQGAQVCLGLAKNLQLMARSFHYVSEHQGMFLNCLNGVCIDNREALTKAEAL